METISKQLAWAALILTVSGLLLASFPPGVECYRRDSSYSVNNVRNGYGVGSNHAAAAKSEEMSEYASQSFPNSAYPTKHSYSPKSKYSKPTSAYGESKGDRNKLNYHQRPDDVHYKYSKTVTYESITYQEFNSSYHCGVIPETNFELYRSHSLNRGYGVNDVAPFGKFPWTAVITYKNNIICTGSLIQSQLVLTSTKCIPEYGSLSNYRVRVGDWDLLSNYNEYEAYKNLDYGICGRWRVNQDADYSEESYQNDYTNYFRRKPHYKSKNYYNSYGEDEGLLLLKIDNLINYDKTPHVKPICLPVSYSNAQDSYQNSYEEYGSPEVYAAPIYDDNAKSSEYERPADYIEVETKCWVAGWYGSKKVRLENHPHPTKQPDYHYSEYFQKYYKGYDKSLIQMRALVKRVNCPKNYNKKKNAYSASGYGENVCFVGVDGYDSCVADMGAAVFCLVPENPAVEGYDSGYSKPDSYYGPGNNKDYPQQRQASNYKTSESSYGYEADGENGEPEGYNGYKRKDIHAHPTLPKSTRFRAVLYAVVQKPTKCMKKKFYDGADYNYAKKQSKIIRATKLNYRLVHSIIEKFWEIKGDSSCSSYSY